MHSEPLISRADAEAQGYTIDNHAAGRPIAYKGRRFAPTAVRGVYTDLEMHYRKALEEIESQGLSDVRNTAAQALAYQP